MISRIEAVNFRCLHNVSQALSRFHVLAGPNGSGKSTFLEVIRVLGAFADGGLDALWEESRAKQFSELLFCGQDDRFQLAVELAIPDEVVAKLHPKNGHKFTAARYEIDIGLKVAPRGTPQILTENLWLLPNASANESSSSGKPALGLRLPRDLIHSAGNTPKNWRKTAAKSKALNAYFRSETSEWNFTLKNGARRSALSSLPEDERFGLAAWIKAALTKGALKVALRSELMQAPCSPLREESFSPDGATLPLVIRKLQLPEHESTYRAWLEHVRTVLPVDQIEIIEREEDRHSYFVVIDTSGTRIPSWHLSDGTLRLMALTLLPYLPLEDAATFLIEEPENGVHPQAVEAVFQSLSSIYHGQALVATHSPVLVGLIKPSQLLCFTKTPAGATNIITGDQHPQLQQWQGDFNLGRLFAAGILS